MFQLQLVLILKNRLFLLTLSAKINGFSLLGLVEIGWDSSFLQDTNLSVTF